MGRCWLNARAAAGVEGQSSLVDNRGGAVAARFRLETIVEAVGLEVATAGVVTVNGYTAIDDDGPN